MKYIVVFFLLFVSVRGNCQQTLWSRLQTSWASFTNDPQLKYATAGICIMDAQTGKVLFEKNSNVGMAPASTQKIITSIAAFEALGKNYTYKTDCSFNGKIENR